MYKDLIVTNFFIFRYKLGFEDVSSLFLNWEEDINELELPN